MVSGVSRVCQRGLELMAQTPTPDPGVFLVKAFLQFVNGCHDGVNMICQSLFR